MINSLSKDSHITHQRCCVSHKVKSDMCKTNCNSTAHFNSVNNSDIMILRKPAEISFSGLSCPVNLESMSNGALRSIVKGSKEFLAKEGNVNSSDIKAFNKSSKKLIESAVDFIHDSTTKIDDSVKKFLETNKASFDNLLKDAEDAIVDKKKKNIPIDYSSQEYKGAVKGFINEAVDILHYADQPHEKLKSKHLKNFLIKADQSQAVFSALFAAGLACVLRPITIISLPGKKHKDDKIYASSHSISSGAIGYLFAVVISSPIAAAIKKIAKNPSKYFGKDDVQYLKEKIKIERNMEKLVEVAEKEFGSSSRFGTARKYLNMVPEIITSPPKAIITIALIPPILKYVFGIEKKVPVTAQNVLKPTQNYSAINFQSNDASSKNVLQNVEGSK